MSDATTSTESLEVTGTEIGHDVAPSATETFLRDPASWVLVSFVVFMALVVRYLMPMLGKMLDGRAEKIRDQLEQATRLREQAQALLATYKAEQEALLKEAEHIIAAAKVDAAALRANAAEELKTALDRRAQQAKEKIARAEAEAISSIRERIITSASDKARELLASHVSAETEADALARALSAIEQHVH